MNPFDSLYSLNTGIIGVGSERHERPHKPVLLLAALEQIAQSGDPTRVIWSQGLRARFKELFAAVARRDDAPNPELPFIHLRSDGFWTPLGQDGRPLVKPPLVRDCDLVYARLSPWMAQLLASPSGREAVRSALISRYFPQQASALYVPEHRSAVDAGAHYAVNSTGRSAAFRKKILEIYRSQCAACGLQMFQPTTLVDAAHLIPFREGENDHPTNGISLCKNHHWAMDQRLIAPTHEATWAVSPALVSKRSTGEAALLALLGTRVLPPTDSAFVPSPEGISHRLSRLLRA